MIATGGAPVGIVMLQTRFPRVPGDVGHAATWPFPVLYRVVRGASPERVVRRGAEGLSGAFVEAARGLVRDGARGIATSCGFLTLHQAALAEAAGVPVLTSTLMQVAMLERLLPPGRRAGILTISRASLSPAHLAAAGVPAGAPIGTTEGGRGFTETILGDRPELDLEVARADCVEAALALREAHPELGAIVLECTNMAPYAADIAAATGLPVHGMADAVAWFHATLAPRRYPPPD